MPLPVPFITFPPPGVIAEYGACGVVVGFDGAVGLDAVCCVVGLDAVCCAVGFDAVGFDAVGRAAAGRAAAGRAATGFAATAPPPGLTPAVVATAATVAAGP